MSRQELEAKLKKGTPSDSALGGVCGQNRDAPAVMVKHVGKKAS